MILITGASKGIGAELAQVCAKNGHDVVLVARSEEILQKATKELRSQYGIQAHYLVVDLCSSNAVETIFDKTQAENWEIDVLINNAGLGACAPFVDVEKRKQEQQIQVNIMALTMLTHRFLPLMISRNRGRILNIASTAAFQPGPYMAVYFATKAYVLSFSAALRHELRDTQITVTTHCPGPTASAFAALAGNDKTMLFQRGVVATSQEVAQDAYRAMMKGRGVVVHGWMNRITALVAPHLPHWITNRFCCVCQYTCQMTKRCIVPK